MFTSFMKVLDRQDRLKGDLSWTQRTGLMYLMQKEIEERMALEKIRMENNAIASNQHTSQAYLEQLFKARNADDEEELEEQGFEVEWRTPTSAAEVQDVLAELGINSNQQGRTAAR